MAHFFWGSLSAFPFSTPIFIFVPDPQFFSKLSAQATIFLLELVDFFAFEASGTEASERNQADEQIEPKGFNLNNE